MRVERKRWRENDRERGCILYIITHIDTARCIKLCQVFFTWIEIYNIFVSLILTIYKIHILNIVNNCNKRIFSINHRMYNESYKRYL